MNNIINHRLRIIIRTINKAYCVKDIFFQPLNTFDRYCGRCVMNDETLTFAETEFVTVHRVVLNYSNAGNINCDHCYKSLTYSTPFETRYCINCGTTLHNFLISINQSEFDHIISRTTVTSIFHDSVRVTAEAIYS